MALTEAVLGLAADFWSWRSARQPRSRDDIPRLERPPGWRPDWTAAAVAADRAALAEFERRHAELAVRNAPASVQVDHALLGSAVARVRWELDVTANWRQHPGFYVDASLGEVFDLLVSPPPFARERTDRIITLLDRVPEVLAAGRGNLNGQLAAEFAALTVTELGQVEAQLAEMAAQLAPYFDPQVRHALAAAAARAASALAGYRDWLADPATGRRPWQPVGAEAFRWFLRRVALLPREPEDMVRMSRREFARASTLGVIEANRNRKQPSAPLAATVAAQCAREAADELEVRRFYTEQNLLSQPPQLRHYLTAPMPGYLAPLSWLGVTDDLTSPGRLDEDGVSYMPDPDENLPYFYAANARDPRAGIIHEGVHYQQLALSWAHPNPVRRHYYDSGPNEGIAFYNEELMLRAGLFDGAPGTREVIHSFMRLRALRVEIDVGLATGACTIADAGARLAAAVPMDEATARDEAAFFAATPGQGLTYQVGKAQIEDFLADAARAGGDRFDLRDFHDYLWLNGNVPIALLRYEHLGLTDEWESLRA
jgi:hypothetical protein